MRVVTTCLALVAVCLAAEAAVAAEPASADEQVATTVARQRAVAAAWRSLYGRLGRLQLTATARIEDYLASGEHTRGFVYEAIRTHAHQQAPQRYTDGTVAVQVQIGTQQAADLIAEVCREKAPSEGFSPDDFQRVLLYTDRRAIWGLGSARGEPQLVGGKDPVGWRQTGVFGRLQARHRALENAYVQLGRRVAELRISPSLTIGDFLGTSSRAADQLDAFLRTHSPDSPPRYRPWSLCEVDVSVDVADLAAELMSLASVYGEGTPFSESSFDKLSLYAPAAQIRVTGLAAPPEADSFSAAEAVEDVLKAEATADMPDSVADEDQAWLLAAKAAEAAARRKLRQRVLAREAPPWGTVAEWASVDPARSDDIDRLLRLMRVIRIRRSRADTAEAMVELPVGRLENLLQWHREQADDVAVPADGGSGSLP